MNVTLDALQVRLINAVTPNDSYPIYHHNNNVIATDGSTLVAATVSEFSKTALVYSGKFITPTVKNKTGIFNFDEDKKISYGMIDTVNNLLTNNTWTGHSEINAKSMYNSLMRLKVYKEKIAIMTQFNDRLELSVTAQDDNYGSSGYSKKMLTGTSWINGIFLLPIGETIKIDIHRYLSVFKAFRQLDVTVKFTDNVMCISSGDVSVIIVIIGYKK